MKEVIYLAWMKTLAETYDTYADLAGHVVNGQVLLPISHSTFNAQIEIKIDENANMCDADIVEKGDDITIIPVTEDSAARSNGIAPHPLCDKLCYIAGDYSRYTGESKEKYYEEYMQQLESWVKSDYSHPMIESIYSYLLKGTLIKDLVERKILVLNSNGKLTDEYKLQKQGQTGANVRFIVSSKFIESETRVWKNQNLYQCYIGYYKSIKKNEKLCYVSGKIEMCSDKHPSKIRNSGDKSKLLSGNDEIGFTYRGRFSDKNQAVSVSYEISQKAHNALRWLLQKQGDMKDNSAIVCWMVNRDVALPDISKDSLHAYEKVGGVDLESILFAVKKETDTDTGIYYAKQFRKALQGYAVKINEDDQVAVIALDAATTGRLSITYYDELGAQQYIDSVRNWQEHCSWEHYVPVGNSEEKNWLLLDVSPSVKEIALAAFGVYRTGINKKGFLEMDNKLLNATKKRLLPCITKSGTRIPNDIIKAAVNRASQPQTMDDFVWVNQVLSVACAMIRFRYEQEKGEKTMSTFLEDNLKDRNVLFGRLLAVCDYMESRAMYEKGEDGKPKEKRTTNAKRYWSAYSRKPAMTYRIIYESLNPYENKLSSYELKYFRECRDEIMALLADVGFDNRALTEMYLPGYSLQMKMMKEYFDKNKKKDSKGE